MRGTSLDDLLVQQVITNRLLVALMQKTSGKFTQQFLVDLLADTGATPGELAVLFRTTIGSVHVAMNRHKKAKAADAGKDTP